MSRRRLRKILFVAVVLAAAYVAATRTAGHVAAQRLANRLHQQFGVELHWKSAWFHLPLGLSLHHVSITMPDINGREAELFAVDYFRVDLQSLPRASQPLQIASVMLSQPTLRIVRQVNGVVLHPHTSSKPAGKTSHFMPFAVHQARVSGARLEYRNDAWNLPAFYTVLPDLIIDSTQSPGQPLRFAITTPSGHSAIFDVAGDIDLPRQALTFDHFTLAGDLAAFRLALAGQFRLALHGTMALDDIRKSNWTGSLSFHDVSTDAIRELPVRHVNTDVALASAHSPDTFATGALQHADADTDGASLHLTGATFGVGPRGWAVVDVLGSLDMHGAALPLESPATPIAGTFFDRWQCRGRVEFTATANGPYRLTPGQDPFEAIGHEVLAYPRSVSLRPPGFPQSFEQIVGGSVSLRAGIVSFDHIRSKYGEDTVLFDSGRLILEDPGRRIPLSALHRQIELTDISSAILFTHTPPKYPRYMEKVMTDLHPLGGFGITGTLILPHRQPGETKPLPADYNLTVTSTGDAQLTLFGKARLQSIEGSAHLTPSLITIPRVQGVLFGGTAWAEGKITPNRSAYTTTYAGQITASELQLVQVGTAVGMKPQSIARLAGLGGVRATVADTISPGKPWYDDLQGSGFLEAYDGAFASLPVISDIAQHKNPQTPSPAPASSVAAPLTVDEAAGLFTIANRRITFQKIAISSPIIGLEGTGSMGFDRSLDLTLVIAPLGDWREHAKQANIPLISDVAGDVLGAVQKVLNAAQGSLINAVHVGGTVNKPIVQDTPAPALTKGLASLFGQMLQPHQDHRLLNAVQGEQDPPTSQRSE
jgi:hypothetical protein